GPGARLFRPAIESLGVIAGLDIFLRAHQPGIGEIRRPLIDKGIIIAVGEDDRSIVTMREFVERLTLKALMSYFEHMAELQPMQLARQKVEKSLHVSRFEFLRRSELPVDRTQSVAQLMYALRKEFRDGFLPVGELLPVGAETRRLYREHKSRRRFLTPFDP